jgi:hypothetical protein
MRVFVHLMLELTIFLRQLESCYVDCAVELFLQFAEISLERLYRLGRVRRYGRLD